MSLEIRALDLGDPGIVDAIVVLQRASYRVEADLLGARTLPALTETPRQLRAAGERFLGAFEAERLVVHPDRFRRGIAGRLLAALGEHEPAVERTTVATGAANAPARRLYERHGFTSGEELLVGGSIRLVIYERRGAPVRTRR